MKHQISTLLLFLILSSPTVGYGQQRVGLTVTKIYPEKSKIEIKADTRVGAGTPIVFQLKNGKMIAFRLERTRSVDLNFDGPHLYVASLYPTKGNGEISDLSVGDYSETDVQKSFPNRIFSSTEYWEENLKNVGSNDTWLQIAEPGVSGEDHRIKLDIVMPPLSGYLCLLEIRNDERIIVHYPTFSLSDAIDCKTGKIQVRPKINLTYSACNEKDNCEVGYVCRDINKKSKKKQVFVAILSDRPRPLSSFLPQVLPGAKYYDSENTFKVDPTEIGPGFLDKKSKQSYRHVDLLPFHTWSIARVQIPR